MTYKGWLRAVLSIFFGTLMALILFNLFVDPYDFFRIGPWKGSGLTNERLWKIEYLDSHRGEFDLFYFGSSTASQVYPETIESLIPGSSVYNLGVAAGDPWDYQRMLTYLLENGQTPRRVVLQLDVTAIWRYGENSEVYKRFGPRVTGSSAAGFYGGYLLRFHLRGTRDKLGHRLLGWRAGQHESYDRSQGIYYFVHQEELIEADHEAFLDDYGVRNNRLAREAHGMSILEQSLSSISSFVSLASSRGIEVTVILSPPNLSLMNKIAFEDYIALVRGLTAIHPFWDFGGYNTVTLDDHLYYDHGHFRPSIGQAIAARVFGGDTTDISKDFGVLINQQTIDARVERLVAEFEWADSVFGQGTGGGFDPLSAYQGSELSPAGL